MARLTAAQRDELLLELVANQRILTEFARHVQSGIEGMRKSPFTRMLPGMQGAMEAFGKVRIPPVQFPNMHVAQPEPDEWDGEVIPGEPHIAQPPAEEPAAPVEEPAESPAEEPEELPSEDAPVPRKDDPQEHVVYRFPVAG